MKVVLIGFMGSGKSTAAAILAERLNFDLIETDALILKESGFSSVAEIFEREGESRFRALERSLAERLRNSRGVIISPGGGMISDPANTEDLKANGGLLIYLKAEFATLQKRIEHDIKAGGNKRPLFSDLNEAKKLYQQRLAVYEAAADIQIDTDALSAGGVAASIIAKIQPLMDQKNG